MKKAYLLLMAFLAMHTSLLAQWTTSGANIYNSNTGYVGIGTTTPGSLADISLSQNNTDAGLSVNYPLALTNRSNLVNSLVGLHFKSKDGLAPSAATFYARFTDPANNFASLHFSTRGNSGSGIRMSITDNGNRGIGTTTPGSYKLAVAGKIASWGEVRVFPDYVFEKGYKLPSLQETEKYIQANKHLPEVPSAAEVAKEGMSLPDMNIITLKKVEELTLHLIEQDKQLTELNKQLLEQQKQLQQLKEDNKLLQEKVEGLEKK